MPTDGSALPPEPFEYGVPHTGLTIRLSHFGVHLPAYNVLLCLLDAANAANLHWGDTEPIGPNVLVSESARVELKMVSTNDISWYQWAATIQALTDFVIMYEFVHMDFAILNAQGHVIGGGHLNMM